MEQALEEAGRALDRGEVPVGCVLQTPSGETVAVGSNRTNELRNATSHAEMVAFESLSRGGHRPAAGSLTLYVTCEPCIMCASAIVQIGIVGRVVFGCHNPRFGGCGSVRGLAMYGEGVPVVVGGVRKEESVRLLGMFYERTNPNAPRPKKKRKKVGEERGKGCGKEDA